MARNANLTSIIKIDITPGATATLTEINGIESIDWAVENETSTGYFISDDGFGYSDVTAGRMTISLSGKRIVGDTAQDYIVSLVGTYGSALKTDIVISNDGGDYTIPVSIELTAFSGGSAEELEAFEVTFHSDGAWTVA